MVDGKRARGCLVTNSLVEFATRDPELAGMFQLHLACLQTSFAAALVRARAEGELRPGGDPESAAMLVAVMQGMNVMARNRAGCCRTWPMQRSRALPPRRREREASFGSALSSWPAWRPGP
jgi:hypothetical protein